MSICAALAGLLAGAAVVRAQPPPNAGAFQTGVYADSARSADCVAGPAGTEFELFVWAWVPQGTGVSYLTFRFQFPPNLDLSGRPVFDERITRVEFVDFGPGGVEWTTIFDGCPSGWILVFRQACTILDEIESDFTMTEEFCLSRDCDFVLGELNVLNDLSINNPGCSFSPVASSTWGSVKRIYR